MHYLIKETLFKTNHTPSFQGKNLFYYNLPLFWGLMCSNTCKSQLILLHLPGIQRGDTLNHWTTSFFISQIIFTMSPWCGDLQRGRHFLYPSVMDPRFIPLKFHCCVFSQQHLVRSFPLFCEWLSFHIHRSTESLGLKGCTGESKGPGAFTADPL